MKKNMRLNMVFVVVSFVLFAFTACSNDSSEKEETMGNLLTASVAEIDLDAGGGGTNVTIETTADSWTLTNTGSSWAKVSKVLGYKGATIIQVTALENTTGVTRTANLTIIADNTEEVKITVSQLSKEVEVPGLFPSYNVNPIAADASGMSSTAVQLAAKIKLGWNIGNALEATGGETAWGNPKTTKALIDLVKANGFNAIRIPCSWNQNLSNSNKAEISTVWLNRVKEVVQYCIDNEMYVLINIHWDGGWLENNVTEEQKEANNAKQKAFWEQIATHFREFDEHLLFASANEPNVEDATQMTVLTSYHQTFIDAVRSTGGKNAYRTLVIQGPTTDIEKTKELMTILPIDTVTNRMMVEVHYYGPWTFAGLTKDESWGKMFYYWGTGFHSTTDVERNATYGEEADLEKNFKLMKTQFVDKGIPVLLGEFGAIRRTTLTGDDLILHLASRAYYLKTVVKQAKANGLLPFYWDEGSTGNNGFGIFKRSDNTVFDAQALNALLDGLK
ncbi:cellulase family glycosylhydrolase [Flavobacterium sp. FBOR7N2.3]|uniref:Cellulase family glycosylhydrolase n=1 Tax=Flavobacterium magnesitis TaxID=3138077 RepID=A0ABV4TIX9_9FLAO